jgi:hypothetical protein
MLTTMPDFPRLLADFPSLLKDLEEIGIIGVLAIDGGATGILYAKEIC